MSRWVLTAVAIVGLSAIVLVQLEGTAETLAWEALLVVAVLVLAGSRFPRRPPSPGSLMGSAPGEGGRPPRSLHTIEMEVAGSLDPALGASRQLRMRLTRLALHRARLDAAAGPDALAGHLDPETRRLLSGPGEVLGIQDLESVVARVEDL